MKCGACGTEMDYASYTREYRCVRCGHAFNTGCALHADEYFLPS